MIVFLLPGQGSQRPAFGDPWLGHPSWPLVARLSAGAAVDVEHLLLRASSDELVATEHAQLATFAASLVAADALARAGVSPAAVAGHSLGEYTALVLAGALDVEAAARLVSARGSAMRAAAAQNPGTMVAVLGLAVDDVDAACGVDGDAWVANDNAPGQVVVAGTHDGVAAASARARAAGARKVLPVAVAGAFHTPAMAPAVPALRDALRAAPFTSASIPLWSNVDARPHTDGAGWARRLESQLTGRVRWRETLLGLAAAGASVLVEVGPGAVLSGTARRTVGDVPAHQVATPDDVASVAEALADADHGGEQLHGDERVVVSPAAGIVALHPDVAAGMRVVEGDVLGSVGDAPVCSPFSGAVAGVLAVEGERVLASQPLFWMRVP